MSSTNDAESKTMKVETYSEMFDRLQRKNEGGFVPFIVAGDPDMETSLQIVKTFVENGADALEIGFPFSDPVADGPTVQEADIRSLKDGMTAHKAFEFIQKIREFTSIPIGILVYYNIIYKMGLDEFYSKAKESGVNGVLAADLPPEEADDAVMAARMHGIDRIFMAAQTTSNERLEYINELNTGFLYVVAVMGVTGARTELEKSTVDLVARMKAHTKLPIIVGFGISKPEHVKNVINAGAGAAIVASAILDKISDNLDDKPAMIQEISSFCQELKKATKK